MSIDYGQTIAALEDQRALIDQAIAGLRALMSGAPTPRPAAPVAPAAATRPKAKPTRAKAAKEPTAARPTKASSTDRAAAVLAALQEGPLSGTAVAARTSLSAYQASQTLQLLAAKGKVTVEGTTSTRLYRLAG